MEKITEQINKNSMNITVLQFTVAQQEDRLKTLEDKVKFIMENTDKEIFEQIGMQEADSKWVKLQDLYDEENKDIIKKEAKRGYGHAHILGTPCSWCNIKLTAKECDCGDTCVCGKRTAKLDKSEKIEEIISEFNIRFTKSFEWENCFYLKDLIESWLRDKLKEL